VSQELFTTLVLTGSDVRALVEPGDCLRATERAFSLMASGEAQKPGVLGVHVDGGGFHIKTAVARLDRPYFAAKANGNFPGNPTRRGLPTIQGVVVLCDAEDGRLLALIDSIAVTTLRTAAATAMAAKHLARPRSTVLTVVGCGVQGRAHVRALAAVLPLEQVFVVDIDAGAAVRFAEDMTRETGLPVQAVSNLGTAGRASDVCVTCTPAHHAFLGPQDIRPGALVAGVGADHPEKSELHPELFRRSTVVVDVLEQCLAFGDLRHAVAAGILAPGDVYAELGEIVVGARPGRRDPSEVIVFDSTGTALQDLTTAALVFERAVAAGLGHAVCLGASGAGLGEKP